MEIKLKGKQLPRNAKGDCAFVDLQDVCKVFTPSEVTELVNRAIYQLEYQAASHRKRGQVQRDREKLLKQALKDAGKDPKADAIAKQLKGE